jgi:hypothetical protein
MRISSAIWPRLPDALGRWRSAHWRSCRWCGSSSSSAIRKPQRQMTATTLLLRLRRDRVLSHAPKHVRSRARKRQDVASSPGFPPIPRRARSTRDKNSDSLIRAVFCVSDFTDRVCHAAQRCPHWVRSFRNNDNHQRRAVDIFGKRSLCGSPDCSADAVASTTTTSPLRCRPCRGKKRRKAPTPALPPRRPDAVRTTPSARASILTTAAPFSVAPGNGSTAESAWVDSTRAHSVQVESTRPARPVDVSLTVPAPPRSLILRQDRRSGFECQPRRSSGFSALGSFDVLVSRAARTASHRAITDLRALSQALLRLFPLCVDLARPVQQDCHPDSEPHGPLGDRTPA